MTQAGTVKFFGDQFDRELKHVFVPYEIGQALLDVLDEHDQKRHRPSCEPHSLAEFAIILQGVRDQWFLKQLDTPRQNQQVSTSPCNMTLPPAWSHHAIEGLCARTIADTSSDVDRTWWAGQKLFLSLGAWRACQRCSTPPNHHRCCCVEQVRRRFA